MATIHWVLVILALIAFGAAAVGIDHHRWNLVATGLFLWLLATVVA